MSSKQTCANPNPQVAPIIPLAVVSIPAINPIVEPSTLSEDFGRDQNLKALLKSLQPWTFTGEGNDVPQVLEEWIMSMEDYFALAEYNSGSRNYGKSKIGRVSQAVVEVALPNSGKKGKFSGMGRSSKEPQGMLPSDQLFDCQNEQIFILCTEG